MGVFRANNETDNVNEHNMVKNPNWREADQLAIYKHDRGVDQGSTEKKLQLSGRSGTWTRDLHATCVVYIKTMNFNMKVGAGVRAWGKYW